MWITAGWIVWCFSAVLIILQMFTVSSTFPRSPHSQLWGRYLEDGADEEDRLVPKDPNRSPKQDSHNDDDDLDWFSLGHWVQPSTLTYDLIQAFLFVGDAFFMSWILWGCFVHCGILPDERVDRRRSLRRVKDGRGVFAPLKDFDALTSDSEDEDDDDKSRDSMEYGDSHEDNEYGDMDLRKLDKEMAKAAEEFFRKAEERKKAIKERKEMERNAPGPEETILLLDLEDPAQKEETRSHADVVFL